MRSLVSYDDLELVKATPVLGPPPGKKRKRQQNKKPFGSSKHAHWDDPVEDQDVPFTGYRVLSDLQGEIEDVESRELTHEEIWDDSALIEAWEAATDEYRAFHGSESKWKTGPILKPSPLWHNVPLSSSDTGAGSGSNLKLPSSAHEKQDHTILVSEHDSVPLDFNTFVPSQNPALPSPVVTSAQNLTNISRDEAFRNALNAMYWTGYWTAIYYCGSPAGQPIPEESNDVESVEPEVPDVGGTMDEFVTSQR